MNYDFIPMTSARSGTEPATTKQKLTTFLTSEVSQLHYSSQRHMIVFIHLFI